LFLFFFTKQILSEFYLKSITDSNHQLPIDVTTDKNIKKIITKFQNLFNLKKKSSVTPLSKKYSFLNNIDFLPPKLPKVVGKLEKMGGLMIFYNERLVEIDPMVGSFRRYKKQEDYPSTPLYLFYH
jgi:hypothetical protein